MHSFFIYKDPFQSIPSYYFSLSKYNFFFYFREWFPYFQTIYLKSFYLKFLIFLFQPTCLSQFYNYFSKYFCFTQKKTFYNNLHFRSPLLTKSLLILNTLITKMFQFIKFFFFLISFKIPLTM